jgi:hypothetical protein
MRNFNWFPFTSSDHLFQSFVNLLHLVGLQSCRNCGGKVVTSYHSEKWVTTFYCATNQSTLQYILDQDQYRNITIYASRTRPRSAWCCTRQPGHVAMASNHGLCARTGSFWRRTEYTRLPRSARGRGRNLAQPLAWRGGDRLLPVPRAPWSACFLWREFLMGSG